MDGGDARNSQTAGCLSQQGLRIREKGHTLDRAGNSYVAGRFGGTVIFGAGEVHETTLSRLRGALFVAKYDRDGRLRWVRQAGGPETFAQASTGLTVDGAGNSYVTGIFEGTAIFGAGEAHETTLTAMGGRHGQNIFVAKYDRDGRLRWVRQAGSPSINGSPGLVVDRSRNTYITGGFRDTLTFFGAEDAPEVTLTNVGAQGFVAKYDGNGRLRWARQSGGTAIAVDHAGNSHVTGGFAGTVTFGEGETQETILTGSGGFLAKYDRNGQLLWARSVRSGGNDKAIMVDRGGDISVIGNFVGSVAFGSINMYETSLHTDGCDIFVAKYDTGGRLLWARQAGGTGYKYVYGAAVDSAGHSYVTGYVPGPAASFGNDATYHRTLNGHDRPVGSPKGDIFVAKLIGGAPLGVLATPR